MWHWGTKANLSIVGDWWALSDAGYMMTKGALTLGPRPRARAHLHTKVRNGLASVSTPSVLQHGTGPWPRHTWERCAVAKVQMLMR